MKNKYQFQVIFYFRNNKDIKIEFVDEPTDASLTQLQVDLSKTFGEITGYTCNYWVNFFGWTVAD